MSLCMECRKQSTLGKDGTEGGELELEAEKPLNDDLHVFSVEVFLEGVAQVHLQLPLF